MRFAAPWAFLLIPLVVIYCWFCRRGVRSMVFSSSHLVEMNIHSRRQRCVGFVGLLETLSLLLIVVAIARPQVGREKLHDVSRGVAIQMVIDVSSSMDLPVESSGKKESRLEIAKRVFEDFIGGETDSAEGRRNDLMGMIKFARYADTLCPLTLGHDALLQFVRDLEIESQASEDGTAIGDALVLAAARLSKAHASSGQGNGTRRDDYEIKSKVIILLTDGENNCGRHMPMEAAALAQEWGIRVHTIGFGDGPDTRMVQTPAGEREVTVGSADTQTLSLVAQTTGGVFRMANDADSLRSVYREIDAMEKSDIVRVAQMDYGEAFGGFTLAGLACLLLEALLAATLLRRLP